MKLLDLRNNVLGKSAVTALASCNQNVLKLSISSYNISMDGMKRSEDIFSTTENIDAMQSALYKIDREVSIVSTYNCLTLAKILSTN